MANPLGIEIMAIVFKI